MDTEVGFVPPTGRSVDPAQNRGAFLYQSGYDATKPKNKRQAPSGLLRDEDRELPPSSRRQLLSATRDIHRNFSVVSWAVRKHIDYVTEFVFQARTGDDALDAAIEKLIEEKAKPQNFDVARRHGLYETLRMQEARVIVDGDILFLKLNTGQMQVIEGDRCRTPYTGLPATVDPTRVNHGIVTNPAGAAIGYVICTRAKTNDMGYSGQDMQFERVVPATWIYHRACWDMSRFDQVRGISPIASAVNNFRDVYENIDYALVKAKVAQLFALAVTRKPAGEEGAMGEVTSVDPNATNTGTPTSGDGTSGDPVGTVVNEAPRYTVDFGRGPVMLDLDPGDDAKILESQTPSTQFQDFMPLVIQIALKAIDLPYSFYDEAHTNWSGQRQGWINYEKSCRPKRKANRDFLDDWTRWRLQICIDDGELVLPDGWTIDNLVWEWKSVGTPWLDPLKEALADIAAIEAGLESPIGVCARTGDKDAYQIVDETAAYLEYRRSKGLADPPWAAGAETVNPKDAVVDQPPAAEDQPPKKRGGKDRTAFANAMTYARSLPSQPEVVHA